MVYGRFTLFYFDATKKDDLLSQLASRLETRANEAPGFIQGRLTQLAENRMVVGAFFKDKSSADANSEGHNGLRDFLADFVDWEMGEPVVREGELVWGFDTEGHGPGTPTPTASYATYRATDIDPSKYDSLITYMESVRDQYRGVSGLIRLRIARIAEDRVVAIALYDSKASSDKAQENAKAIMSGGSEFFTGNVVFLEGDLVWSGRPGS